MRMKEVTTAWSGATITMLVTALHVRATDVTSRITRATIFINWEAVQVFS